MRIRWHRLAALVVAAAAVSCSSGGGKAEETSSSLSSQTAQTAPSADQEALRQVALQADDLPAGVTLKLIPGGDQVTGQVTLDMCGADFPSEELRTARLQQIARDASNVTVVNDENVRYRSAHAAKQALMEVRQAVSGCDPTKLIDSHVAGVPLLRYRLELIPDDQIGGLAEDHVAIAATFTKEDGTSNSRVLIYQRRGAVLVGVYGPTLAELMPFAKVVAGRLAALTANQVGD